MDSYIDNSACFFSLSFILEGRNMAEFNGAVERTLKFEGILSNDKYDAGGLTNLEYQREHIRSLILQNLL